MIFLIKKNDENNDLWYLKHSPQTIDEVAGNSEARELTKKWALDWKRGKRGKPLLFWGPAGVGKTALANALAREFGWTLVSFSANVERGEKNLNRFFAPHASGLDLYGTRKILVVEEVDAVFDRGEIPALSQLLQETNQPTVLIAEDAWNQKLAPIRALCTLVQFKKINWLEIKKIMSKILEREGVRVDAGSALAQSIEKIVRASGGDIRSALIDLQTTVSGGEFFYSERERKQNVFDALRKMFAARSFALAISESDSVDVELKMFVKWIEENLPLEASDSRSLAQSFDALSKADVFEGRTTKKQDYSLSKYARALACGGTAVLAKSGSAPAQVEFAKYKFPTAIKKLSDSKNARATLANILKKIVTRMHCSKKQALETMLLSDSKNLRELAEFLELSEPERKFLAAFKA